jgi:hypothetical protein
VGQFAKSGKTSDHAQCSWSKHRSAIRPFANSD